MLIALNLSFYLNAQTRLGSINLTGSEGRSLYFNDDKSGSSVGVEGKSFTVEGWVRMTSNGDNDFCFFTINSGNQGMSLAWTGDYWKLEAVSTEESTKYGSDGKGDETRNLTYNQSGYSGPTWLEEWHHVAFVYTRSSYNGNKKRLYIDGELAYSDADYDPVLLLEDGGDGGAVFGGDDRIGDNEEGKIHLAELRIWRVARSATEIQQNYQHEVNSDDSDWNNLVRYYHGHEISGSGTARTFKDRSPIYVYDGVLGNSDIDVTKSDGYTPPVGPPHLKSNSSMYSFSAKDCDTDNGNITITISGLNSGYTLLDPGYSVTNLSTGVEVVSGLASSSTINIQDNTASREDKVTYELRAYYQYTDANGVTQTVYSNDNPSGVGEITGNGTNSAPYDAPSLTVSTDNCDKSIDLSWSASDGTPPQWKIEKSTSSTFSSIAGTATTDGGTTTYTSTNQAVETNIYYRVSATGTDDNGCTVTGTTSSIETGFTSKVPSVPTNATITQDLTNKQLKLAWTNPSGNNADSWIIKRSKFDGSSEVEFTTALGTTSYDDTDLELCETYSYTLGAVNECSPDGEFATTDLTSNISTDLSDAIATMEASKGYLSDAVQVEWSLNGSLSNIDRFRLYRSRADKNNFSLIKVLDNDLIYTDETALGSVFYNYKVVGEAACNENTIYTNEGIDMGFVIPYGVANGHIEYDGGNAVEDVTVNFERQDGASGNSLEFDGVDDYVAIKDLYYKSTTEKELTVEAWVKVQDGSDNIIASFDRNEYWRFEIAGSTANTGCIGLGIMTNEGQLDFGGSIRIDDGEWHYVAATYDNGLTSLYVDGVLDKSTTKGTLFGSGNTRYGFIGAGSEADTSNNDTGLSAGSDYFFGGNIDELRIWAIARSADEIAQNYNRIINGSEEGLIAYYRCDEGIGSNIYDASLTDDEHNKHDGVFINEVAFSDDIPSSDQLGIKGITDEYGDYTINYIPYSSSGEIFRVTPSYGQHAFEPNSRTVYIGDGAQTQNGLDFTDISSFTVSGKVNYQNSQVPVAGVSVLLDGAEVLGEDNQVIRTDDDGNYEINVPIGRHYLSVYKDGHVFAEGYFPPLDEYGSIAKYEFVEDLTVNFTDSTKIKVAGRIVGGDVEGNKTIGFGLSTNNIGVAELKFKLLKEGYDIDTEDTTVFESITITTDPYSGEYEIEMIPESWVVQKAGNDYYFIDEGDLSILDLSNSLTTITVTNTLEDATLEEYSYYHLLNYIIREQPIITVTDGAYEAFDGDTLIVFTNQVTDQKDTLILGNQSALNFPVFQMGKNYTAIIAVNEYYNNPDHPDGAIADQVPVEGATISIVDNLAILSGTATGTTDVNGELSYNFVAGVPSLTENGEESYTKTFEVYAIVAGTAIDWGEDYKAYILGSSPLEGTDFVSSGPDVPEVILRDPPGSNSYAYIEKGSTFSESTSYVMQTTSAAALDLNVMAGVSVEFGGGLAGPVVEANLTNNTTAGISVVDYYDEEGVYSRDVTFTERIETSADPDDVGSPADLYIGKSYNIFYTKSKNFKILPTDFCIANGLTFVGDSASEYCLGMIDGFVINDDGASTYFIYSQRHILNELLPNLFELRNSLLLTSDYVSHLSVESPYYGMNNDDSSLDDWKTDLLAQNPSADVSELVYSYVGTETDQIRFYNNQITLWLNAIAINEAEKASADVVRNISIDGTAGSFTSEIEEMYASENNYFHARDIYINYEQEFGAFVNDNGASISVAGNLGYTTASGGSNSTENSLLFGYVIEDEDESDYYSIDVLKSDGVKVFADNDFSNNSANSANRGDYVDDLTGANSNKSVLGALTDNLVESAAYGSNAIATGVGVAKTIGTQIYSMVDMSKNALDLEEKINQNSTYDISGFKISSPIFSVKGGQTKCPYHDEEYASFYVNEAGETPLLNTGTIQREVPIINVSPSIRNNVPDNQSATFTLSLENGNDALGEFYEIMIDESTNPDGLELLIDGLTAERAFYINPLAVVEKTLTVNKTKADVMDYDSVAIIFRSTCQYDPTNAAADIGDTVFISVHFLPSCADVEITSFDENWILNYEDGDAGTVTLSGYDLNLSTLEKIDFQYKTLSGSPLTMMSWYPDTTASAYQDNNGAKDILEASTVSFNWDISALTDRAYQLRARAVCTDGSVTESDYLTGLIDRVTPVVFGAPSPSDGILGAGEDLSIRFNEELEAGLVKDHNISVRSVLNGADVSHGTSVGFNGVNEYARIPAVAINSKSFTIEYWLQKDDGVAGTVFNTGAGTELIQIEHQADETILVTLGSKTYTIDPSAIYTTTTPASSWHHWAFAYDMDASAIAFFGDDKLLHTATNVVLELSGASDAFVAKSSGSTNYLAGQMHELRIWEEARTLSESVEYMNQTLNGSELGLLGYWPMDEGTGVLAEDLAAARNMALDATWILAPGSDAFGFDGSTVLSYDATNLNITPETDFTIEFWVQAATPSSAQTIFSTGRGDLSDSVAGNIELAISIDALPTGQLKVISGGNEFVIAESSVLDNQWHHIALVSNRQSSTKTYVDGALKKSYVDANIAGIGGAIYWLGARGYKEDPSTTTIDQNFIGSIDEFRVWQSARSLVLIELYQNSKLVADEQGLLSYVPFETYETVLGATVRTATLKDVLLDKEPVTTGTATYVSGASIKDVRPVQDVSFDFVVNGDEIVITPLIDANRVEGQVLKISVQNLYDLNGNRQLSPVSWTAFVEQNELVWDESIFNVSQEYGVSQSFTATIVNLGGVTYNYTLENVPTWLSTSDASGTVAPNSAKTVTFKVSEGLNIGSYSQGINLSTSLDYDEKLIVNVEVNGESPDWEISPENFNYSMNLFGRVLIEDVVSTDADDKVAAYVNGELRGVANLKYIASLDEYLLFMTIYSNNTSGENIEFVVWDASKGKNHEDVTPNISFEANSIVGSSANPQELLANDNISQSIALKAGWNWISFNLESDDLSSVDKTFAGLGSASDLVKSQNAFDTYDESLGWLGGLTLTEGGLNTTEMYKVYLTQAGTLKYLGSPVDAQNTVISLDSGWNYMGFTPQTSMTIEEALVGINPKSNVVIKSQKEFALYDDVLGWIGSLTILKPNTGYMIRLSSAASFSYPSVSSLSSSRVAEVASLPSELEFDVSAFADNMSIIASVDAESQFKPTENDYLVAFVNGQQRSACAATVNEEGKFNYYLSVPGFESDALSFKFYNEISGEYINAENVIVYENNQVIGSGSSPYRLQVEGWFAENEVQILPNPFTDQLSVSVECETGKVELFNSLGELMLTDLVYGSKTIDVDANLPSGMYIIRVTTSCGVYSEQLIK